VRSVTNVAAAELRAQLADFVRYRREYLTGDEKGEARVFCDRLFRAFGPRGRARGGCHAGDALQEERRQGNGGDDAVVEVVQGEHLLGLAELVTSQADIAKVVIPTIDQVREQRCRGGTAAAGRAGLLVDPLSTLRPALVAAWQSGWEPGWQRAVTGVRPISAATRVAPVGRSP
jgi:hypothetical protein